eukprot:m.183495 g.183495  ORF g.183495 m.183495 type:complete len:3839 (+) comp39307_c0_seq2:3960-15476(+)
MLTAGGEEDLKKLDPLEKELSVAKSSPHALSTDGKMSTCNRWETLIAWMMNISPKKVAVILEQKKYVLTQDFCYKIILLHERKRSKMPVIFEGETGAGKTYMLDTYAALMNECAAEEKDVDESPRIFSRTCAWLKKVIVKIFVRKGEWKERVTRLQDEDYESAEELAKEFEYVCKTILDAPSGDFVISGKSGLVSLGKTLTKSIKRWFNDIPLLTSTNSIEKLLNSSLSGIDSCVRLLKAFLETPVKKLFYKLLIHPGLTNKQVIKFLKPIIETAKKVPDSEFLVFFDELNTGRCLGLFKEMLIDNSINGKMLPQNIFFVGAINPYSPGSLKLEYAKGDAFPLTHRDAYPVYKLPFSMESIVWVYGSMSPVMMEQYISSKIRLQRRIIAGKDKEQFQYEEIDQSLQKIFTNLLLDANEFFSKKQASAVSQRDVQRVFQLLPFMLQHVVHNEPASRKLIKLRKAIFMAVATVYYLRLPVVATGGKIAETREAFAKFKSFGGYDGKSSFSNVVKEGIDQFVTKENFQIPPGIALNQAVKENVFVLVACIQTGVPLGIVGPPGSSKTLSFHIVRDSLRGRRHSPTEFCKRFHSVDSFFYQCSEYSTAADIEATFCKATKRQEFYDESDNSKETKCVVFLDEAGLPSEKEMVLKILHPYLDNPVVSCVVISNKMFDPANANRMVVAVRSLAEIDDLETLAFGCLGMNKDDLPHFHRDFVNSFCEAYSELVQKEPFKDFFHYRDFIYALRHFDRHAHLLGEESKLAQTDITPDLVLEALERNMNGLEPQHFEEVVETFFRWFHKKPSLLPFSVPENRRDSTTVLFNMLTPNGIPASKIWTGHTLSPRFVMLIDPTSDSSAIKLLFHTGFLSQKDCRIFHLSNYPGDCSSLHDAKVLSNVRYAIESPCTAVLVNTGRIHGSLYDLLNQTYRFISGSRSDVSSPEVFANIATGASTYPCRVNAEFRCVVLVKQNDIAHIPAPFLSRFSKFRLSAEDFLQYQMRNKATKEERDMLRLSRKECLSFVEFLGKEAFIGFDYKSTVPSLLLSTLEMRNFTEPGETDELLHNSSLSYNAVKFARDHYLQQDRDRKVATFLIRLLQLVPPEVIILKLSEISSPWNDVIATSYFCQSEHFILSSVLEQLMEKSYFEVNNATQNKNRMNHKKLLIYSRTNNALTDPRKKQLKSFVGEGNYIRMQLADAQSFQSVADINQFLVDFLEAKAKSLAFISVGARCIADLPLLFQMIEDAQSFLLSEESTGTLNLPTHLIKDPQEFKQKHFVILLHFPPEHIFSHSHYSAQFLSGWETLFMDLADKPKSQNLRCFAKVCAQFERDSEETNELVKESGRILLSETMTQGIFEFSSTLLPPIGVLECQHLPEKAQPVYLKKSPKEKISAIESIFELIPAIPNFLSTQVALKLFSPSRYYKILHEIALKIWTQRSYASFANLMHRTLQEKVISFTGCFLQAICSQYNLASFCALGELSGEFVYSFSLAVLNLLLETFNTPKKKPYQLQLPWRTIFQTPLFSNLKKKIEDYRKCLCSDAYDRLKLEQKLHEKLKSDPATNNIISVLGDTTESNVLIQGYISDLLYSMCCESNVPLDAKTKQATKVPSKWLMLGYTPAESVDVFSFVHAASKQHLSTVQTMFSGTLSLLRLGGTMQNLLSADCQNREDFRKEFICYLLEFVWQCLAELTLYSREEHFEGTTFTESLRKWISAYHSICKYLPPGGAGIRAAYKQTHRDALRRAELMSVAYAFLCGAHDEASASSFLSYLTDSSSSSAKNSSPYTLRTVLDLLYQQLERFKAKAEGSRWNRSQVVRDDAQIAVTFILWHYLESDCRQELTEDDVKCIFQCLKGNGHFQNAFPSLESRLFVYKRICRRMKGKDTFKKTLNVVLKEECQSPSERVFEYIPLGCQERDRVHPNFSSPLADLYYVHECSKQTSSVVSTKDMLRKVSALFTSIAEKPNRLADITEWLDYAIEYRNFLSWTVSCLEHCQNWETLSNNQVVANAIEAIFLDKVEYKKKTFISMVLNKFGVDKFVRLFLQCDIGSLKEYALKVDAKLERNDSQKTADSLFTFVIQGGLSKLLEKSASAFCSVAEVYDECYKEISKGPSNNFVSFEKFCQKLIKSDRDFGIPGCELKEIVKVSVIAAVYEVIYVRSLFSSNDFIKFPLNNSCLAWRKPEKSLLSFLLSPISYLANAARETALWSLFCERTECNQEMLAVRDVVVSQLAFTTCLCPDTSYFGLMLTKPNSIVKSFPFGCSSGNSNIPFGVRKFDFLHQYTADGKPMITSASAPLSPKNVLITSLLTFTSLTFSAVLGFVEVEKMTRGTLSVLTEAEVELRSVRDSSKLEKVVNFCWERVSTTFNHLRKLQNIAADRCSVFLRAVVEIFTYAHVQETKELKPRYASKQERDEAENYFDKTITLLAGEQCDAYERQLEELAEFSSDLSFYRQSTSERGTYELFCEELRGVRMKNPDKYAILLAFDENLHMFAPVTPENRKPLAPVKLILPIARLYIWIHENLSGFVTDLNECFFKVIERYFLQCSNESEVLVKGGVREFNLYCKVSNHTIEACGQDDTQIVPITKKTKLNYLVSDKSDPDCADMLYRAIQRLLTGQENMIRKCQSCSKGDRSAVEEEVLDSIMNAEELSLYQGVETEFASLIKVDDLDEFKELALSCCRKQTETLQWDLELMERFVILRYLIGARRINLQKTQMKMKESFRLRRFDSLKPHHLVSNENFTELPAMFAVKFLDKELEQIKVEIWKQHFEEVEQILRELDNVASAALNSWRQFPESSSVTEQSETGAGIHHQLDERLACFAKEETVLVGDLDMFLNPLPFIQLKHLVHLHRLFLEHFSNHHYLHADLPSLLRQALPESTEKELNFYLKQQVESSPQEYVRASTEALQLLTERYEFILGNSDRCMIDCLMNSDKNTSSNLLAGLPPKVSGKHYSAVMRIILRHASSARSDAYDAAPKLLWPLERNDEIFQDNKYDVWLQDNKAIPASEVRKFASLSRHSTSNKSSSFTERPQEIEKSLENGQGSPELQQTISKTLSEDIVSIWTKRKDVLWSEHECRAISVVHRQVKVELVPPLSPMKKRLFLNDSVLLQKLIAFKLRSFSNEFHEKQVMKKNRDIREYVNKLVPSKKLCVANELGYVLADNEVPLDESYPSKRKAILTVVDADSTVKMSVAFKDRTDADKIPLVTFFATSNATIENVVKIALALRKDATEEENLQAVVSKTGDPDLLSFDSSLSDDNINLSNIELTCYLGVPYIVAYSSESKFPWMIPTEMGSQLMEQASAESGAIDYFVWPNIFQEQSQFVEGTSDLASPIPVFVLSCTDVLQLTLRKNEQDLEKTVIALSNTKASKVIQYASDEFSLPKCQLQISSSGILLKGNIPLGHQLRSGALVLVKEKAVPWKLNVIKSGESPAVSETIECNDETTALNVLSKAFPEKSAGKYYLVDSSSLAAFPSSAAIENSFFDKQPSALLCKEEDTIQCLVAVRRYESESTGKENLQGEVGVPISKSDLTESLQSGIFLNLLSTYSELEAAFQNPEKPFIVVPGTDIAVSDTTNVGRLASSTSSRLIVGFWNKSRNTQTIAITVEDEATSLQFMALSPSATVKELAKAVSFVTGHPDFAITLSHEGRPIPCEESLVEIVHRNRQKVSDAHLLFSAFMEASSKLVQVNVSFESKTITFDVACDMPMLEVTKTCLEKFKLLSEDDQIDNFEFLINEEFSFKPKEDESVAKDVVGENEPGFMIYIKKSSQSTKTVKVKYDKESFLLVPITTKFSELKTDVMKKMNLDESQSEEYFLYYDEQYPLTDEFECLDSIVGDEDLDSYITVSLEKKEL